MVRHIEDYVGVDEALKEVRERIHWKNEAQVLLARKSYGRVTASEIVAPSDVPKLASSHMDGFAVIARDLQNASNLHPTTLKLKGEIRLGSTSTLEVKHGETVRVATGAFVPTGADTVIPSELVREKAGKLVVSFTPALGSHVYNRGEDVKRGQRILDKGHTIRAQDIGLLIRLGIPRIRAFVKPTVAILATGSELTRDSKHKAGKVIDSHTPVFLGMLRALGCVQVDMGLTKDSSKEIAKVIREALTKSDFVLTLGGTSAGKHDLAGDAISRLRPGVIFHGIRMDRGRVTGIAVVNNKPVLMMPGPIQGAMNAFILFAIPIIRSLSGREDLGMEVNCRLGDDWNSRKSFPNFTKVVYVTLREEEETVADPILGETESITVLSRANGYVVVPENVTQMDKGTRVKVALLPGFSFAS